MKDLPLGEWQMEVLKTNVDHGWFDSDRSWSDSCALLISEIYEMFEAYRSWELDDATEMSCPHWSVNVRQHVSNAPTHLCKPEGVGSELADVLVRWLDTVEREGFVANAFPQEYFTFIGSDGFSGHIMSGTKHMVDAWWNDTSDMKKFALRQVLAWIFGFAVYYEIDLAYEYERKIAFNKTRPKLHGGKKL